MTYGPSDDETPEHKLPLTRAIPVLAKATGSTRKQARELLLEWGPCGWFPTGKYNRRTDFYDVEQISRLYCFDE
jgi:hypothetical protein